MLSKIRNLLPFVTTITSILVALRFGSALYHTNEPIVDGILSVTIFFLIYRNYFSPVRVDNEPIQLLFQYPTGFKYLGPGVLAALISYWASSQIAEMVFYLIKLLGAN